MGRGPSFANVKDKRGTKERPPGPEGYHCPPPPPSPVISTDPFQVILEGYSVSQFGYLLTCILNLSKLPFINLMSKLGLVSIAQPQAKKSLAAWVSIIITKAYSLLLYYY